MGMASKTDRFNRSDGTHLGTGNQPLPASMNEFERLEQFAKLQKPPSVKFKDLDAVVSSSIRYNTLPFKVGADYIKLTDSTVLTTIIIKFEARDLRFKKKNNVAGATGKFLGNITSIAGRLGN